MIRLFLFAILVWAALPLRAADLAEVTLPDGRRYLYAAPAGVAHPPLILGLHGGGGSPEQFARDSGLARAALAKGFAVAFPAGSGRTRLLTWNGGYCCGYAAARKVDDVGFLRDVIADATHRFGADATRVFATGMSNGAIMAQTLAARAPAGTLRGVVSVAGTIDLGRYRPQTPVPLLHIHGTEDDRVPYGGGVGDLSVAKADFTGAEAAVAAFRNTFREPLTARGSVLDRTNDGMRTEVTEWVRPDGSTAVTLMKVVGGGHDWPGGTRSSRRGATRDFEASVVAVEFFSALL